MIPTIFAKFPNRINHRNNQQIPSQDLMLPFYDRSRIQIVQGYYKYVEEFLRLIFADTWGVHTDSEDGTDDDTLDVDHDKKLKENLPTFPDLLCGICYLCWLVCS